MDLFSFGEDTGGGRLLADRMRPENLDEYIGQEHIIGRGKLLRRAIEADQVSSILLYGPRDAARRHSRILFLITHKESSYV